MKNVRTNLFCFTDFSKGFGGKFGKDEHAQDKSAVGFSHHESLAQHSSQKGSMRNVSLGHQSFPLV